jgi:hypothetical protein
MLYNRRAASVVKTESRHWRIEIRPFPEERPAHIGLRKCRGLGTAQQ